MIADSVLPDRPIHAVPERPVSPDSCEKFGATLRELRQQHGHPTLTALEFRTGISKSVLSVAFSGRKLPTENTIRRLAAAFAIEPQELLERRSLLANGLGTALPSDPPGGGDNSTRHSLPLGIAILILVGAVVLSIAGTSAFWLLQGSSPLMGGDSADSPLHGNDFADPVSGADPMLTECREDKVIAAYELRQHDTVQVEMLYSNACMGVWGRVTRSDGLASGNDISMRIYPAGEPESGRAQERSASDVNSVYTPLLIEPEVEARVCGLASMTKDDVVVELGPPVCI